MEQYEDTEDQNICIAKIQNGTVTEDPEPITHNHENVIGKNNKIKKHQRGRLIPFKKGEQ